MKTPLFTWHETHGARFINDRGIELPAHFTDSLPEYQAVRETAGLIDSSFRVQVRMTGEDRVSFLQGIVSNDIKALRPGEGCAATLLTEQGRLVADLRVYVRIRTLA
jgi:glycine cleavage system aminomethyltransferase T